MWLSVEGHGHSREAGRGGRSAVFLLSSCQAASMTGISLFLPLLSETGIFLPGDGAGGREGVRGEAGPATAEARSCRPIFMNGSMAHSSAHHHLQCGTRSFHPGWTQTRSHLPRGWGAALPHRAAPWPPFLPGDPQTTRFPPAPISLLCHALPFQ